MTTPIAFSWDGKSMVPLHPRRADRVYVVGERYTLVEHHERSHATHSHQFAWLKDAWMNLPEELADNYPTPEHLRKRALIDCGFFNETAIDCGSNAAALRVASHIRSKDDFAMVFVRGVFVIERTAKSQSRRAMDAKEFNASKQAILEHIAGMIGTEPGTLLQEAGKAA